jgi:hypothetical protein
MGRVRTSSARTDSWQRVGGAAGEATSNRMENQLDAIWQELVSFSRKNSRAGD